MTHRKQKQHKVEVKPFGVFHGLLFDIRDLPADSFGPMRLPPAGRLIQDITRHNQVTQVGLNGWAKLANEESGFTGVVNYCAVGTGANDPDVGDVTLQTEIDRVLRVVDSNSRTNNVQTMEFYFGPDDANGEIKEIGAFVDGTGAADSGTMFDRSLFDVSKTNLTALYIYFSLTFSA